MPPITGRISSTSSPEASASRPASSAASSAAGDPGARRLRADARRNRQQLLAAARDVFVEHGPDAPLDEVARRAGVGIATLYRHFSDRATLRRAVALDVLARAAEVARRADAEEADAWSALARYMHDALDLRISAVMPALLGSISFEDDEFRRAREAAVGPVLRILAAGQAAGQLRDDVAFGDVGLLLVRLSRPLPGPLPTDLDLRLAHRHLDLVLAGLRPPPAGRADLSGPALSLAELQHIGGEAAGAPEHALSSRDPYP